MYSFTVYKPPYYLLPQLAFIYLTDNQCAYTYFLLYIITTILFLLFYSFLYSIAFLTDL